MFGCRVSKPHPIGKIEIEVPAEAKVLHTGKDMKLEMLGSALFKDVPVGTYALSSGGTDVLPASTNLDLAQGATARWKPYATGAIIK